MQSNKTIIFINPGQFGYKAGYYYYCKYLKQAGYNIKLLCFDHGHPKVEIEGVKVEYIPFFNNKILRTIEWQKAVFKCIKENISDSTIFFINYFKFCAIFGLLFPKAKKVLDIRTGSLELIPLKNWLQNFFIRQTTKLYSYVTILSEGLIDVLKLNKAKCHWLPLGSEIFSTKEKKFDDLRLLYVGSLNKRRIHETIKGLAHFLEFEDITNITYDIFGSGSKVEEDRLLKVIAEHNLKDIVRFHGRKNHNELQPYFDKCNVGISFVPMTKFFEYQPPTKTFEYILSGMVCIATGTYENKKLMPDINGIICQDSFKSFAHALDELVSKKKNYNSAKIRQTLVDYTWSNIINRNLQPYLENLFK